MLFADRLEVWNPGRLPGSLTIARLREPHGSVPHNPLLAEPLYLTQYSCFGTHHHYSGLAIKCCALMGHGSFLCDPGLLIEP